MASCIENIAGSIPPKLRPTHLTAGYTGRGRA